MNAARPTPMLVSDFDYDLPEHLIAQYPADRRDQSRLLVVERDCGAMSDQVFSDLPDLLSAGDLLVINDTRVFPARLKGTLVDKGMQRTRKVEVFLVRQVEGSLWEALVRPGRALPVGARVEFGSGELSAEVVNRLDEGRRVVRFDSEHVDEVIDRIGLTPLPPYIKRSERDRLDEDRYQTIYARRRGAIAAPTAGLHFTPELLDRLAGREIALAKVTLHVGYGTFQPVRVGRVEDHRVEAEMYSISEEAASAINRTLEQGGRVIAVGTTTTRALESSARGSNEPGERGVRATHGLERTDLFIYPGFEFRVTGGLVTNFHLPRSSLLMLVAAFAGGDLAKTAYRHAVESAYRFYSYGDAMLIL